MNDGVGATSCMDVASVGGVLLVLVLFCWCLRWCGRRGDICVHVESTAVAGSGLPATSMAASGATSVGVEAAEGCWGG